jgi:hypothetical protein
MINSTCTLLIAIPSVILLIVVLVMPYFFSKQNQKVIETIISLQETIRIQLESGRRMETDKRMLGLKLQAYERGALFLERINPANIIPRLLKPGLKSNQLEKLLVDSIRDEYEHNMSQQLYITDTSWEQVKMAKESIITLISTSATKVDDNAPGSDLAKEILTKGANNEINMIYKALAFLKSDLQKNFK